jgi:hypothetical protein
MPELLKHILQKSGSAKHEHLFHSVENLNKMPDRFIKDASLLSPEEAELFFRYMSLQRTKDFWHLMLKQ